MSRAGYDVRTANSGRTALKLLEESWPALLVIDLMMPGMDGFELARRVKQLADLPIIVLSAVDGSEAKVTALELYAEDYVTKPFDPDELVARIQRVLRRASVGSPQISLADGDVEVDLATRRLTTPAGTHQLTPTEARLLQVLASAVDRVVPTDELLSRVWTDADGADPVVPVGHRPAPAPQARERSGPPAAPHHRARHRLPPDLDRDAGHPGLSAMPQLGPWLRVAGALLLAVLPPLLLLTASLLLAETVLTNTDPSLIAGFVVLTAIAWSLALAIVYSRGLAEDVRSLLALAERGDRSPDASLDDAYRQLAGTLDERNRQVAALATESARVPIDESPRMVVAAVVASVREVTGDATWRCAVLASESEDLLPPGTYHAPADPIDVEPISELEQWAAVAGSQEPASRVEGPWGAFLVVGLAAHRPPARDPLRPGRGTAATHARGGEPPDPGRTARGHRAGSLAPLHAGPQPGGRAGPHGAWCRRTSCAA